MIILSIFPYLLIPAHFTHCKYNNSFFLGKTKKTINSLKKLIFHISGSLQTE